MRIDFGVYEVTPGIPFACVYKKGAPYEAGGHLSRRRVGPDKRVDLNLRSGTLTSVLEPNTQTSRSAQNPAVEPDSGAARYLPLALWLLTITLLLIIPLKITGMGFMPEDDVLRHVGKVLSGKSWPEIILTRQGFGTDEHPGWHAILGVAHRWFGLGADGLTFFSLFAPCAVLWLGMLIGRKRPDALLFAMFAAAITASGNLVMRPMLGRPFVFIMIIYVIVLQLWANREKITPVLAALTVGLIGVSVWVHGSWYLFGIVPTAFVLAGQWRKGILLGGCWAAGTFLGGTFTGHPVDYITLTTKHLFHTFSGTALPRMFVTELRPSDCDVAFLLLIAMALIWRVARGEWRTSVVRNPLFILAAMGWLLGLQVGRFWFDWGFPAALLWLAQELEEVISTRLPAHKGATLLVSGFAAVGLFFATTRDINGRWTGNLTTSYVTPETPGINEWLPEAGGIVYNYQMDVFFRLFYKFPQGPWRYVLGFESGIMPEEDFAVMRAVQWADRAAALDPWLKKMRAADRMILIQQPEPMISGLEWRRFGADTWIGRLPKPKAGQ